MCINSLMIDTDIIQCLLEDLLDRICSTSISTTTLNSSPIYYSSQSIENKFNQSINLLNNSLKQLLTYELNTVVQNGQLSSTSNIRHSRYYNPATTIKQSNDLKKRLHWIEQRQMLIKQFNLNERNQINQTNFNLNSMENIWFHQRLKMLDNAFQLIKKEEEEEEEEIVDDDTTCARCRIYQRKKGSETQLFKKIKHFYQVRNEHNYSRTYFQCSTTPESDLIASLSKIADRIGRSSHLNLPNSSKKLPKKKQAKFQSSISLIVGDSQKNLKRTSEESRNLSNSNFISNNYDFTHKRQKRIASPLSVSSSGTPAPVSSASPHEILTPTWRMLNNNDVESSLTVDENEDISDESYIRRHIRCELEQETWLTNPSTSNHLSLTSTRKSGTLQTSLSVPNGLSTTTTNPKQYQYRLTPNGIAYTETMDTK